MRPSPSTTPQARGQSTDGEMQSFDGVGVILRGDVVTVFYGKDARPHRAQWLFDRADELVARCPEGILALVVVPETSKPPDPESRKIEAAGYTRLRDRLRRVVLVPEGNDFHLSIVRLVVTAYIKLVGKSAFFMFGKDVERGAELLAQARTPKTPSTSQLRADVQTLRRALGS